MHETATPKTAAPPKGQAWYVLAESTLGVALVYAAVGFLIRPSVGTIPYWLYVMYTRTVLYIAIGLIGVTALLILTWVILAARGATRTHIPTLAGLLVVLASVIGAVAVVPSLSERLFHRDSRMLGDSMYYLAFDEVIDNNNTFFLYECDRFGLLCTVRYISQVYPLLSEENAFSLDARLVPNESPNAFDVWVEGVVIHTREARMPDV